MLRSGEDEKIPAGSGSFEFSTRGFIASLYPKVKRCFVKIRSLRNMTEGCHLKSEIKCLKKRGVELFLERI